MTTIAEAAAGINAAKDQLIKVAKESMTQTKTAKNPKSIAKLKKRSAKLTAQLQQAVEPLNNRLKPMHMLVWWDGKEYRFNSDASNSSNGNLFRLGDHGLAELMAMSDRKLETFLKGF